MGDEFMNHLWKSRTFRKTFFSYVIILGIPMIIFSILYLYTTIQEEQEKIYASYTRDAYRIAKAVDDKMMELKHLGTRMSNKSWIKKRSIQADIYQNEFDVFKQQEMKEELRNAISESGILSFGVIIYPEKEILLSPWGEYKIEEFSSNVAVLDNRESSQIFFELLDQYHILKILSPITVSIWGEKKEVIPIIQSLEIANEPRSVLILFIDSFYLSSFITRMTGTALHDMEITDKLGNKIYNYQNPLKTKWKDWGNPSYFELDSEVVGWNYFMNYPSTLLPLSIQKILFIIFSGLLAICIGVILSFLFAKISYKPLDLLLKKISDNIKIESETREQGNLWEYKWIEESFQNLAIKNKTLQEKMKAYKKAAKSNILIQLLKGYFQEQQVIQKLQELEVNYTDEIYFSVLVIRFPLIEQGSENNSEALEEEIKKELMILMALEERLSAANINYELAEVTVQDRIFILSSDQNYIEKEEWRNFKAAFQNHLQKHMKFTPDVIYGPVEQGLIGISKSYYIVNEDLQYLEFHKNNILYTEKGLRDDFYYYPTDWEVQLINNLKVGNIDTFVRILDEVKQENIKRELSHTGMMTLLTLIMETILRVIKELNINGSIYVKQFTSKIETGKTEELWNYIYEVGSLICERIQYINTPATVEEGNQILLYVNEHYTSPEMSLKNLSEMFNMSVSKVSKLFKEVTGINFQDYICRMRIEKAKELLRGDSSQLTNIAQQVGYEHTYSFRRAFVRYEGIKPDEYILQFDAISDYNMN